MDLKTHEKDPFESKYVQGCTSKGFKYCPPPLPSARKCVSFINLNCVNLCEVEVFTNVKTKTEKMIYYLK